MQRIYKYYEIAAPEDFCGMLIDIVSQNMTVSKLWPWSNEVVVTGTGIFIKERVLILLNK